MSLVEYFKRNGFDEDNSGRTYPGVELFHFCVNDNYTKWKRDRMGHTMGETLYWKYIGDELV